MSYILVYKMSVNIFKIKLSEEYESDDIIFHINNWMKQYKGKSYIERFDYSSFKCNLVGGNGILGKILDVTFDATVNAIFFTIERFDYARNINLDNKAIVYKASYNQSNKIDNIIKFLIKDTK